MCIRDRHGEVEEIGIEFKRAQHRAAQAAEAHLVEHKKRAAVRDLQQPPDGGRGVCCADMRDIGAVSYTHLKGVVRNDAVKQDAASVK